MHHRTEQEIMKNWQGDITKPVVSVCCITYNHEKYIAEALDSFLMQETDFPFEVIVRDDASPDKTADIIREYEVKYPNIIKPIYEKENGYSKGIKATPVTFKKAVGEYIALCEGDDYWTDVEKLQIQKFFLENNPSVMISGHDAFIIDENNHLIKKSKLPKEHHRDFSSDEVVKGKAWLLTMAWMFRNIDLSDMKEIKYVLNGDTFMTSVLGNYGSSHHHEDIKPAAYRVHSGGVWSKIADQEKIEQSINTVFWIYKYYKRLNKEEYAQYYWNKYINLVSGHMNFTTLVKELFLRITFLKKLKLYMSEKLSRNTKDRIKKFLFLK